MLPLRPAAALSAAALLMSPVLAHAVTQPSAVVQAPPALAASWPAVPVAERLQPWLAQQLSSGATADLRVSISGESTADAVSAAGASGLRVQQTWDSVGIVVAVGTPSQVRDVTTQPGVTYVEGETPITPHLATAHTATRSAQAMETYTHPTEGGRIGGRGVSIAVIDSGIDGTHPFFQRDGASTVVANLENVCTVVNGPSDTCFVNAPISDTDTNGAGGHGTHVAGIVAGVDTTLADGRQVRGAAPDASLVGLSVGAGLNIINANAAMQWVVDHQSNPCRPASEQGLPDDDACPPIRVTNHSYGPGSVPEGGHTFDPSSATVRIQRALVDRGVTVVWSAGNSAGDGETATTNPPAMDPTGGILMVASYDDAGTGTRDNALSTFSSRGKKADASTWPDIAAPGDLITSSCRAYLPICTTGLDPVDGPAATDIATFNTISGTSMSAPYIAGVVAQLVSVDPSISPAQVEDLLEDTAYQFGDGYSADLSDRNADHTTSFDKGHGLVDVAAALAQQLGTAAPSAPAPACTTSSYQVQDRTGDAVQVVLVDTPLPSESNLDVERAHLGWDGANLTFTIEVADLTEAVSGTGEYFRFYVTRDGDPEVYAVANRDLLGQAFSVRAYDAGTSTTVTGAFDPVADTVTVVLPAAQYGDVVPGKSLAVGDRFTVGSVLAQRDTGVITATADTAEGSCPFVVGTSTPGVEPVPADQQPPCEVNGNGNANGNGKEKKCRGQGGGTRG